MRTLRCSHCREQHPESLFSKQKKSSTGRQAYCKPCVRDLKYRSRYGLTAVEVADKLTAQNNRCACCNDPVEKFVVDHCHATGAVRGLLCNACNVLLGQAQDCPERLRKAIGYLDRAKR